MTFLVIAVILVVLLIPLSVFAQEPLISVQTDNNSYEEGDVIVISGMVTTIIGEDPITFQLFSEGNLVDIASITIAQDRSYSHTVLAEGPLWKKVATYTVRVSYAEGNTAESEFSFTPKSESIETTSNFEVNAGSNGTFDVKYTVKGGENENRITESQNIPSTVQISDLSLNLTVNTDSSSYNQGDIISIVGVLENSNENYVDLYIKNTQSKVIWEEKFSVKNDGTFSTLIIAGGDGWQRTGTYTIFARHNSVLSEDSFSFTSDNTQNASITNTNSKPKELGIASFVDKSKDPKSYIDRYNNEPSYKNWFHENYSQYDTIEQAVGLQLTQKIPDWVKNIFGWYAQDQVSEDELLNAIKYLINEKILVIEVQ